MICLWFGRDPFPKCMPLPRNSFRPVSGGPGVGKLSPLRALSAPELPGGCLRPLLRVPGSSASPSARSCLEEPLRGYRSWAHSPTELRHANPSEQLPGTPTWDKVEFPPWGPPFMLTVRFSWHLRSLGLRTLPFSVWTWKPHTWNFDLLPKAQGWCFSRPKPFSVFLKLWLRQRQPGILLDHWCDIWLLQITYCPWAFTSYCVKWG